MAVAVLRQRRMMFENAVVAVCNGVGDCESAVLELCRNGVAADAISVVTVDAPAGLETSAYYFDQGRLRRAPDQPNCRRLWEALSGWVVVACPGERTAVVAGPLAATIVRVLDQGELLGKLGPLAAGLYTLGIPRNAAREYELAALQGRSLVVGHGRSKDLAGVRRILAPWLGQARVEFTE